MAIVFNADEVLGMAVEIERNGHKRVWFIDFSHTGNGLSGERTRQALREEIPVTLDRGHVLRDCGSLIFPQKI